MIIESIEAVAMLTKEESLEAALDGANNVNIRGAAMKRWRELDRAAEVERLNQIRLSTSVSSDTSLYEAHTGREI